MQFDVKYILIYAILLVLPAAYLHLILKRRAIQQKTKGVTLLQAMRILVKNFQTHRGLTASYIAGTPNISSKLDQQKQTTHETINNISKLSAEMERNQDWGGITSHWARLATHRSDALDNFDQHCKIIASTTHLMRRVAYTHKLARSMRNVKESHWYNLLCLAETLGQIRANGIYYLSIENHNHHACMARLKEGLSELGDYLESTATRQQFLRKDVHIFFEFKEFINRHIIDKKGLISQDLFFAEASKVIDVVHEYLDNEIQMLYQTQNFKIPQFLDVFKPTFRTANPPH